MLKTMDVLKKNGEVSAYGFACGYVQEISRGSYYKRMYMINGVYFVSVLNSKLGYKQHSFEAINDARFWYKNSKVD